MNVRGNYVSRKSSSRSYRSSSHYSSSRTRSRRQSRTNRNSGSYYSSRTSRSNRASTNRTRRKTSYRARGGIKTSSGSYYRGSKARNSRIVKPRSRNAQLQQESSKKRTNQSSVNRNYYTGRSNRTSSKTNNTSYYTGKKNIENTSNHPVSRNTNLKKSSTRKYGAYYPTANDVENMKTVKKGSSGMHVVRVQLQLKKAGYKGKDGKELALDGKFGPNTEYALKEYQKKNGLTADGIAGQKTYRKMYVVDERLSNVELEYFAKTVYGEARGENRDSKIAVAWVIRNRVESNRFPNTYKEVVTQKKQFSCWEDHNYNAIENPKGKVWEDTKEVAKGVISGEIKNPVPKILHYYSPKAMNPPGSRPPWSDPDNELEIENVANFLFVK